MRFRKRSELRPGHLDGRPHARRRPQDGAVGGRRLAEGAEQHHAGTPQPAGRPALHEPHRPYGGQRRPPLHERGRVGRLRLRHYYAPTREDRLLHLGPEPRRGRRPLGRHQLRPRRVLHHPGSHRPLGQ